MVFTKLEKSLSYLTIKHPLSNNDYSMFTFISYTDEGLTDALKQHFPDKVSTYYRTSNMRQLFKTKIKPVSVEKLNSDTTTKPPAITLKQSTGRPESRGFINATNHYQK